jgi:CHAT domain-containing protein
LISRPSTPEAPDAVLEGLHEVLARPVFRTGALEGVDHLIVVPHNALAYLPFEALRNPEDGRFLVEDFDIRVLPSAEALVAMGTRPAPGPPDGATTMIFAPLPSELPGTRSEAQAVGEILPGATLFMGGDATEKAVRDALGVTAPVHVATHGVMNAENPMFSRVVLAAGTTGDGPGDGRLEVHEILDLEVRTPLVFLSGCETGVGRAGSTKFTLGEDYTTLAQAFLQAGARNVVATLWRVDDEASAVFARRFYQELGKATPTASLASTQREMIRDPEYSSPYHWAGYQLLGDDLEVIFPP